MVHVDGLRPSIWFENIAGLVVHMQEIFDAQPMLRMSQAPLAARHATGRI